MAMHAVADDSYRRAMGHLLVLYTQVDQFIMETCAARIRSAPSEKARLGLARQVGDECRHVNIQKRWMAQFGVDPVPVIGEPALAALRGHFAALDWVDYLTDLYLVIEALGSQAVEQIVPLADPGTRESLRVPLQDEIDHVTFGFAELREALDAMPAQERDARLQAMPSRIDALLQRLQDLDVPVMEWFKDVGVEHERLTQVLRGRRDELLDRLAA